LLIRRALLMMLAGASVFWILFGALTTPVAAAGLTWHSESAAGGAGSNPSGGADHPCRGQSSNHPGDDDGCCKHCCASPPHSTRTPVPTAGPTSPPKRPAPPTQARHPKPSAVVAPHPSSSATTPASSAPASTAEPTAGPQPPVLAPPALTIPALVPASASKSGGGAVALIALSSVLVAATVAVASLALIRRSS
jgi:hypothetical protein